MVANYNFLEAYTQKIYCIIVKIVSKYIESIEDEDKLRAIVFEKDYENRDSLDLISKHEITEIMDNKNMEKIALELWTSQYDVKGNLMTTSSILKIIMYDSFNKPRDIAYDYFFTNWKYRTIDNFDHHLYQLEVWKKSMKAKFQVEGVFLLITTIIFQFFILTLHTAAYNMYLAYIDYFNTNDPDEQAQIVDRYLRNAKEYYNGSQTVIALGYISISFPIRILLVMLFSIKSKRQFKFVRIANLIDIGIFLGFLMRLYLEYRFYRKYLDTATDEDSRNAIYFDNIIRKDHTNYLDTLYC